MSCQPTADEKLKYLIPHSLPVGAYDKPVTASCYISFLGFRCFGFKKHFIPSSKTMIWYQILRDGPEYEARKRKKSFTPPDISLKDLHDAVPRHLFERSALRSSFYVVVHVASTFALYLSAKRIPAALDALAVATGYHVLVGYLLRPLIWLFFWGWQGMFFAGIWCLGTHIQRLCSSWILTAESRS